MERSIKYFKLNQLVKKFYLIDEFVELDKVLKLNYFASEKNSRGNRNGLSLGGR